MTRDDRRPVVVLTGASSGLGRAAASALAQCGARVAVVGRNAERTRSVAASIEGGEAFVADFSSFAAVRDLADRLLDRFDNLDVLANNAGGLETTRHLTADEHETTIQVNHLSPFLLTRMLLPRLAETAAATGRPSRVISTASVANLWGQLRLDDLDWQRRRWNGGWRAYGSAKVATVLFTRELAKRTATIGIEAYAFHPGFVATSFAADSWLLKLGAVVGRGHLGLSPEGGALPLVELATLATVDAPSGTYFDRMKPHGRLGRAARDDELARRLWELSERLTAAWAPAV